MQIFIDLCVISIVLNDKRQYKLAENWQEVLQQGHYTPIANILMQHTDKSTALLYCFTTLTGINGKTIGAALKAANAAQRAFADPGLYFSQQLIEEVFPHLAYLHTPCEDCPYPTITIHQEELQGPGRLLEKQNGQQMEDAFQCYAEFLKSNDMQWLHRLVAVLYFPAQLPYSAAAVSQLAQACTQLPIDLVMAVFYWYNGVEEWYRNNYQFLYDPAPSGQLTSNKHIANAPPIDSLAVSRILRLIAGNKRGTVEQVRAMPRDEIYFELAELHREAETLQTKK